MISTVLVLHESIRYYFFLCSIQKIQQLNFNVFEKGRTNKKYSHTVGAEQWLNKFGGKV
jgi:hypothetical protein